jgi:molecular chaperone GrpE
MVAAQDDSIPTVPGTDAPLAVSPTEPPEATVLESPEALREAVAAKSQEVERVRDRLLRLQAEFENFRKRMAREKAEYLKYAHEGIVLEFLPVLDNLERAIASARAEAGSTPLLEGVEMTARLFRVALEKAGVKPMEVVGQPFDPAYHQAVEQVESSHGGVSVVVGEVQKGYLINGRVLRPAMVRVSRSAPPVVGNGRDDGGSQA